jgi:cell division protein FtsL
MMARYVHGNLAVEERYQPTEEVQPQRSRRPQRNLHRFEKLIIMVLVFVMVAFSAIVIASFSKVHQMNLQIGALERQISQMEVDNSKLRLQVEQKSNLGTIEQKARKLGLVKVDEKDIQKIGFSDRAPAAPKVVSN